MRNKFRSLLSIIIHERLFCYYEEENEKLQICVELFVKSFSQNALRCSVHVQF